MSEKIKPLTREETQKYLEKNYVSDILKLITTEMILYQPTDPILFINKITKKILSKPSYQFNETVIKTLYKETRSKTTQDIEKDRDIQVNLTL